MMCLNLDQGTVFGNACSPFIIIKHMVQVQCGLINGNLSLASAIQRRKFHDNWVVKVRHAKSLLTVVEIIIC